MSARMAYFIFIMSIITIGKKQPSIKTRGQIYVFLSFLYCIAMDELF